MRLQPQLMEKAHPTSTKPARRKNGSVPLAHTSWLRPFVDYFGERNIDLSAHIAAVGIEPELIFSGDGWITKQQLYRFLDEMAIRENMPELGFVVGERLTHDTLGVIGDEMARAETLGEAVRQFCRLIPRHVEGNEVWIEGDRGGEIWLLNKTATPAGSAIADHGGLMSLINIVRLALGREWYPDRMRLQAPQTDAYRRVPALANRELQFGCEATGFAFPAEFLFRKISTGNGQSAVDKNADGLLLDGEPDAEKLKRLVRGILGTGGIVPTIELMADVTGVSARTLHRRLKQAGVSYQALLDEVRYDRARNMLVHSDVSVKELAYELGYSGANNFIRAFRRLAGMTPGQFREERVAG